MTFWVPNNANSKLDIPQKERGGRDACHLISADTLPINKQLKHVVPVGWQPGWRAGRLHLSCPVPVPDTQKYLTMTKEYLKS